MQLFNSLQVSASGLTAQRVKLDVIANNLANASATRTPEGGPYQRKVVVLGARGNDAGFGGVLGSAIGRASVGSGVQVMGIRNDTAPFKLHYDPSHPDAGPDGYVRMPNVDTVMEMVDLIAASRAYEANVTAFNAGKQMALKALEIGR